MKLQVTSTPQRLAFVLSGVTLFELTREEVVGLKRFIDAWLVNPIASRKGKPE